MRRALAPLVLLAGAGTLVGAAAPVGRDRAPAPSDTLVRPDALVRADTLLPAVATGVAATGEVLSGGALDSLVGSLTGVSGKVRAHLLVGDEPARLGLTALLGASVERAPSLHLVRAAGVEPSFAFITPRPFAAKVRGRIGPYRMGYWPYERGRAARLPRYDNPLGFIEVTPENQDTYVSEHFRLRDFLTHDQQGVWPKYLVLDTRLVDKLELVIAELQHEGVRVRHLAVMSGFRTPRYNALGVGRGGRAATSRHQYGDAADVFVDNDENGRTDDVNGDGRVDVRDAQVVQRAVERVEADHPELIGGVGVYPATRGHGPFTHIDARGYRARWGEE